MSAVGCITSSPSRVRTIIPLIRPNESDVHAWCELTHSPPSAPAPSPLHCRTCSAPPSRNAVWGRPGRWTGAGGGERSGRFGPGCVVGYLEDVTGGPDRAPIVEPPAMRALVGVG